jgi:predicted nucleotidyltransferase
MGLIYNKIMESLLEKINIIKESILKNTPAKYIYLFGSYAYGKPTDKSDIDIYLVLPDNTSNILEIYGKIMVDLGIKKYFLLIYCWLERVSSTSGGMNICLRGLYIRRGR